MFDYNIFRLIVAPEYKAMENEEIDVFANQAKLELHEKTWGALYPRAWALVTAHLIAMSKKSNGMGGNSATGQLTKTKVGDLERQFAQTDASTGPGYDLTVYGIEYLRLRKKLVITPVFA